MERLDKLLAGTGKWSRREVKALVRQGLVRVDGRLAASAEDKLDPAAAIITVAGETISLCRFTYVMLHKPAGVLTATEDRKQPTVLDLLPPELRRIGLAPVGRLDKDTEGLLLLINDGELAHRLEVLPDRVCIVTLREGKFHQVKRMLAARGAPVLYLKRLSMGPLTLDDSLAAGAYRLLRAEEISALYRVCGL